MPTLSFSPRAEGFAAQLIRSTRAPATWMDGEEGSGPLGRGCAYGERERGQIQWARCERAVEVETSHWVDRLAALRCRAQVSRAPAT